MTCIITFPDKHTKEVKNLGWLLRHAYLTTHMKVESGLDTGSLLKAYLRDGREFKTYFASAEVLWGWLHRPMFSGTPLTWDGYDTTIRLAMKDKYPEYGIPVLP